MNIGKIEPIQLDQTTAYLAGAIIGDGHIYGGQKSKTDHSNDYRITIEVIDKEFLEEVESLIKQVITTKSKVQKRNNIRIDQQPLFYFQFRNKSFFHFLTTDLQIPKGKKSATVEIPQPILSNKDLHFPFLSGLFDTDGGKRGKTIGFTSKSQKLMQDVSFLLKTHKIKHFQESWLNKKYQKIYCGIKISSLDSDRFLKGLQLRSKIKRQLL